MAAHAIPPNEAQRLSHLYSLNLLDTPKDDAFDSLTRLAAELVAVPIALVSLLDRDRQWFKSAQGLCATQTPRDISFCNYVVADAAPLVVNDARRDPASQSPMSDFMQVFPSVPPAM